MWHTRGEFRKRKNKSLTCLRRGGFSRMWLGYDKSVVQKYRPIPAADSEHWQPLLPFIQDSYQTVWRVLEWVLKTNWHAEGCVCLLHTIWHRIMKMEGDNNLISVFADDVKMKSIGIWHFDHIALLCSGLRRNVNTNQKGGFKKKIIKHLQWIKWLPVYEQWLQVWASAFTHRGSLNSCSVAGGVIRCETLQISLCAFFGGL